jgi:hypothetical protein
MAKATAPQKKTASQLLEIAKFNAGNTKSQLNRALSTYDTADQTARAATDVKFIENSRQGAADRFSQQKKLQMSAKGILGAAGNAMQGSQMGGLAGMLRDRQDMDTGEVLGTLGQNQNAARSSLNETITANEAARRDAINTAAFGLGSIEADTAAQLSAINPSLYKKPGKGKGRIDLGSAATAARMGTVPTTKAQSSGYFLPSASVKTAPAMQGNSYFDRLMNSYNQRRA